MDLVDFKTTFDGVLQTYIEQKIALSVDLLDNKRLKKIMEYIQTFIFSGGKRLRPYCVRAVYTGLGGREEKEIIKFAVMFEVFHAMALIHDDIIDSADKRHNVSTMHGFVETLLDDVRDKHHAAEGQAILVGDLMLGRVSELLYKEYNFPTPFLKSARENIHSMIEEVILGQMIDVDLSVSPPESLEMISKKNLYKTAGYTFIRPMTTGAMLAGANAETLELVKQLAENLGLAFQLRDDLFDLTGADKTKSVFTDIQEGQQTYFTHYIFTNGTEEEKVLLKKCLGNKVTEEQVTQLKQMFESSGAIAWGKEKISEYVTEAKKVFAQIELVDIDVKHGFDSLMKKLERTT